MSNSIDNEYRDALATLEVYNGHRCPECGSVSPHDWNGESGDRATYICVDCGHCWEASEVVIERWG